MPGLAELAAIDLWSLDESAFAPTLPSSYTWARTGTRALAGRGAAPRLDFGPGDGDHENYRAVEDSFDRAIKLAGVSRLTFHGTQATTASLMAQAGIHRAVIAEHRAHRSPEMTGSPISLRPTPLPL